jgi:hypothetical protein
MYFAEIVLNPAENNRPRPLHDPYSQDAVVIKGDMTQVINAIGDFQFEILPTHPLYAVAIKPYVSTVRIRNRDNHIIFRSRVIDSTSQMGSNGNVTKSFVAECELAYLLDSMQEATELRNFTTEEYLTHLLVIHNRRVRDDITHKRIDGLRLYGGTVIDIPTRFDQNCLCGRGSDTYHVNYGNTYENIKNHVVDPLGGFIWLEYLEEANGSFRRILNYAKTSGNLQKMPIELAINLENMTSNYRPSQNFTRLIPLGATLARAELAINRLAQVGLLTMNPDHPFATSPQFWMNEIKYQRKEIGKESLTDQEPVSEWSGQLLLGLATLHYKNECLCLGECVGNEHSDDCKTCYTTVYQAIDQLRDTRRPDVNSRMAYNRSVDYLCHSGMIGSSEYWKEEDNFRVPELRSLIRLAALTMASGSPRRGDSNWLDVGDGGWVEDDDLRPPEENCGDEDCQCEDCSGENCQCNETCKEADCQCEACSGADCACGEEDDIDDGEIPPEPVKIQPYSTVFSIERALEAIEVPTDLSPWIQLLRASIRKLNLDDVSEAAFNTFRTQTEANLDNVALYEVALDSLANSGVIHSPSYWKQAHLSSNLQLRLLIRLVNRYVNRIDPTRMNARDALRLLRRHRLVTVAERDFWRNELTKIEALENAETDEERENLEPPFSEWIPELLSSLSLINFELGLSPDHEEDDEHTVITALRESIRPDPSRIPDINDEGAYYEAVDSLANAGAIGSPDYWKEPSRRRMSDIRWLIRLADLTVDPENPRSDFPRPRLTITEVNEGMNWLPVIADEEGPIIEGTVIFDTNDPIELKEQAKQWIAEHHIIHNSVSMSALDLSHLDDCDYDCFKVGDYYQVVNPLLGIEGEQYPLIERKIDVVNPLKSDLTFGGRKITMTSSQKEKWMRMA